MLGFLKKLFGGSQNRQLTDIWPIVDEINEHFADLAGLSDDELKAKTTDFRARLALAVEEVEADQKEIRDRLRGVAEEGKEAETISVGERQKLLEELDELDDEWLERMDATLDEILPEAFAVIKETCRRMVGKEWEAGGTLIKWDMIPYDVQLLGGVAMHQGRIAEMKTGEGKTLVGVAPMYLNALAGRGVHVVTVNPYLAQRDAEWMAPIFAFHGLTVDVIDKYQAHSPERREGYRADITYGTNNEFGFDYLRDNSFVYDAESLVQRGHHFAIIDEVDSVLIDEARTPLIISGPVPQSNDDRFAEFKPAMERLVNKQKSLVAGFVSEAEKELKARDESIAAGKKKEARQHEEKAGLALLRAQRGYPKNRKLAKMLQETGVGQLVQKTEFFYLQDNAKNMPYVDDALLYAVDEKQHSIEMGDKGREMSARESGAEVDLFVLPDIGEHIARMERERDAKVADGTDQDEAQAAFEEERRELYAKYGERAEHLHAIEQLLRAYTMYENDVEYIVQDGKVQIVDEHTGRVLSGRRYSDGLHQAIEAKENVQVQAATQTYATVTLQNYFRLYHKLAGMTGTAVTEAEELFRIYGLDVIVVPTNKPIARADKNDLIFRTKREKFNAVIDRIREFHESGQPVLVGTASVESSETVSRMLQRAGIPHNVLNAKADRAQKEAEIVAQAGKPGAVTIATNMAGRGTDIKLADNVLQSGGLAILGTERHDSRRIDLQLRGRAGRQGDPGESQFYVSFEDDLMRLFGERAAKVFDRLQMEEGVALEHPWASKSIERAQKKVEQNNFAIRKRQLEYDDVLNAQREVIYTRRQNALTGTRTSGDILEALESVVDETVSRYQKANDLAGLKEELIRTLALEIDMDEEKYARLGESGVQEVIYDQALEMYQKKRRVLASRFFEGVRKIAEEPDDRRPKKIAIDFTDGRRLMRLTPELDALVETQGQELNDALERASVLAVIDEKWTQHLRDLDEIKEGINLRAYGQRDPLIEYKMEAYRTFAEMMEDANREVVSLVFRAGPLVGEPEGRRPQAQPRKLDASRARASQAQAQRPVPSGDGNGPAGDRPDDPTATPQAYVATEEDRIGRNDRVVIQNPSTGAQLSLKYKQAKPKLDSGWTLVSVEESA